MDMDAIFHTLTHSLALPEEAIRAANMQKTELVPRFCEEFGRFQRAGSFRWRQPHCLFLAFHLLGSWRATNAYGTLARFLKGPPAMVDAALGGATTETPHRVMAAVYDGDPTPLHDIILDSNADEFIRSRMCESLAMLVHNGRLPRDHAEAFFRDAFLAIRPKAQSFVWCGWQQAIALLELRDLVPLVQQDFEQGFIGDDICSFEDFQEDIALGRVGFSHQFGKPTHEFTLFGDTIAELSTWYCFSEKYRKEIERHEENELLAAAARADSDFGPGRNDPCPCGSGKKHKKCCLFASENSDSLAQDAG